MVERSAIPVVNGPQMAETIREVREYEGQRPGGYGREAGFQIVTNEQTVTLAIDDEPSCCEQWGYFLTEDEPSRFVGAALLGVRITDENRSSRTFTTDSTYIEGAENLDAGNVMFVDILTDRGTLQFVAYNSHNGYYSHEARVSSKQLTKEEYL